MRIRKRPQTTLPPPDLFSPVPTPQAAPPAATSALNEGRNEEQTAPKGCSVLHPDPSTGWVKEEESPSLVQAMRGKQEEVGAHKTGNIGGVHSTAGSSSGPKFEVEVGDENGGIVEEEKKVTSSSGGNRKRRRRPAVLMEGSRCSRVNGRGWRCCQQTLVGYSLCEHHLGKGRLRSMSSVRCNNGNKKKNGAWSSQKTPSSATDIGEAEEDEQDLPRLNQRRKKIGMVKARSISSLLHQTDEAVEMMNPEAELPAEAPTAPLRPHPHREGISAMV